MLVPKCPVTSDATSRIAHWPGGIVGEIHAAQHERGQRVGCVQRAVRAAAHVRGAAPVEELVAGRRRTAGPRRRWGTSARTTGVRARRGRWASAERCRRVHRCVEHGQLAVHVPGSRPARRAGLRRGRSAARRDRRWQTTPSAGRSCASRASQATRSTPSIASARVSTRRAHRVALVGAQRVDHRRALGRADGDLRLERPRASGPEARVPVSAPRRLAPSGCSTPSSASSPWRSIVSVTSAWEWSAIAMNACSARNSSTPPGGLHHPRELQVGGGDRGQLAVGAVLVRVPVVVGQGQQQEVEQVVLDHVLRHAARVAVAHAGHAERRAAARAARGEDVGVEQLARAHHRVARERAGEHARERGVALGLVAVAAAVHQVGRAGGAHIGVVERLEHGERLAARGGRGSCCRRCRSAAGRSRTAGRRAGWSRTRHSATPPASTSSCRGCGARPGRCR